MQNQGREGECSRGNLAVTLNNGARGQRTHRGSIAMYINVYSLRCAPETHTMVCANCSWKIN